MMKRNGSIRLQLFINTFPFASTDLSCLLLTDGAQRIQASTIAQRSSLKHLSSFFYLTREARAWLDCLGDRAVLEFGRRHSLL